MHGCAQTLKIVKQRLILSLEDEANMIFLGAGASAPFGIPTAKTLTTDIRGLLTEEHQELLSDIDTYWKDTHENKDPNYENILTFLMGLSQPRGIPRGSIVRAFMKDFPKHRRDYTRVVDEMYSRIVKYCTAPFVIGEEYLLPEKVEEVFKYTYDLLVLFGQEVVFTTNYDPSIEIWCQKRNVSLFDNTKPTRNPEIKEVLAVNRQTVEDGQTDLRTKKTDEVHTLKIVRLHGSVWIYETEKKRRVKMSRPRDRLLFTDLYNSLTARRPHMIFPGQEPNLEIGEWDTQYQYFKRMLQGNCLVIGYSFQDEVINRAFVDSIDKGQLTSLGIVNPHPRDVLQNLFWDRDIPYKKIIEIPTEFGTAETLNQVRIKWLWNVLKTKFTPSIGVFLERFRKRSRAYLD